MIEQRLTRLLGMTTLARITVFFRKAWLLALVPVLLVVILPFPNEAAAATIPWSQPVKISGDTVGAWFPAIAVDRSGQVHVVWNSGVPDTGQPGADIAPSNKPTLPSADSSLLNYTHWDGQGWSKPVDIEMAQPSGEVVRSALTLNQEGQLILFYRGMNILDPQSFNDTPQLRIALADARQGGDAQAWSIQKTLTKRGGYFTTIATDAQGVVHAVWDELDGNSGYVLYYSHSIDGGVHWSPPFMLEMSREVYHYRLSMAVGPGQDIHVVYEVIDPADVSAWTPAPIGFVYAQSKDSGATWSTASFVPSENTDPRLGRFSSIVAGGHELLPVEPAVGVDGKGQVLLVWRDAYSDVLYFQRSKDGNVWSAPEPLPGVAKGVDKPFDRYDMATDSAGHVHLVFVGYPSGSSTRELLHSVWDGDHWSNPDVIASSPPYPEYPGIAIAEGNRLQVVWFVRDNPNGSGVGNGIWYSTAEAAAPFVAPVPLPARARSTASEANPAAASRHATVATPTAVPTPPGFITDVPVPQPSDVKGYSDRPLLLGVGAAAGLLILTVAARRVRLFGKE